MLLPDERRLIRACSGKGLPQLDPGLYDFADKNMLQSIDLATICLNSRRATKALIHEPKS